MNVEYLLVRKKDGSIERFQREKIVRGIGKAASVFNIPAADVNAFIDRILDQLQPESPGVPILSRDIGHLVLRHLQDSTSVTDVARIRFAMVFLGKTNRHGGFHDAGEFRQWLEDQYPFLKDAPRESQVMVIKRNNRSIEPFDKLKLERSIGVAAKGRGLDVKVRSLAVEVSDSVCERLGGQPLVTTQQVASEAMRLLRDIDDIAYLRYAAAVKPFRTVYDFWHEADALERRSDDE